MIEKFRKEDCLHNWEVGEPESCQGVSFSKRECEEFFKLEVNYERKEVRRKSKE